MAKTLPATNTSIQAPPWASREKARWHWDKAWVWDPSRSWAPDSERQVQAGAASAPPSSAISPDQEPGARGQGASGPRSQRLLPPGVLLGHSCNSVMALSDVISSRI